MLRKRTWIGRGLTAVVSPALGWAHGVLWPRWKVARGVAYRLLGPWGSRCYRLVPRRSSRSAIAVVSTQFVCRAPSLVRYLVVAVVSGRCWPRLEVSFVSPYPPGDAGEFVGEGHGGEVEALAELKWQSAATPEGESIPSAAVSAHFVRSRESRRFAPPEPAT
jgi:hypothetical protein